MNKFIVTQSFASLLMDKSAASDDPIAFNELLTSPPVQKTEKIRKVDIWHNLNNKM